MYNNSTGIKHQFLIWNANLGVYGAYQYVDGSGGAGNYTVFPFDFSRGGSEPKSQFILSGQGFFVSPRDENGGTVNITDAAKSPAETVLNNPFRINNYLDKKLYVNLYLEDSDTSAVLADGVLSRFDGAYTADIDADDLAKQANFNENLGIHSQGISLMAEARPDIQTTDTIRLQLWNITKRNYQFRIKADRFDSVNTLHAWIEDKLTGNKQPIALNGGITSVAFSVTNDTLSQNPDRFRIVFRNEPAVLPVTLTSIKASAQNSGVNIDWTVTNETNMKHYTVERSADGGKTFGGMVTVPAKNLPSAAYTSYAAVDVQPAKGDNLYRIRMEEKEGTATYSAIVKVVIGEANRNVLLTVYPNPVTDGKLNLQLRNIPAGTYHASLFGADGKPVYRKTIAVTQAGVQSEQLLLGNTLAQGSYQLIITSNNGTTIRETHVMITR